ncbi:hypothetical protein OAO55_02015 [Bacteroidales bacterium]|nr:hypothetical protein [Bacteroidales bacterium]
MFDEKVEIGGEVGTVLLEIEYLDPNEIPVYSTITKDSHKGFYVTLQHDMLLQNCINKSLLVFNLFDKVNKKFVPSEKDNIPIINQKLEKGFYGSFLELKNNNPQFNYEFIIHNLNSDRFKEKNKTNELSIEISDSLFNYDYENFFSGIYGFCDGENIFIKEKADATRFGFVNIIPNYRYIKYNGRVKGVNVMAAGAGIFIGGLIGGIILGGVSNSGTKMNIIMDLKTGEAHSFNSNSLSYMIKKNQDFYKAFNAYPKITEQNMNDWFMQLKSVSRK